MWSKRQILGKLCLYRSVRQLIPAPSSMSIDQTISTWNLTFPVFWLWSRHHENHANCKWTERNTMKWPLWSITCYIHEFSWPIYYKLKNWETFHVPSIIGCGFLIILARMKVLLNHPALSDNSINSQAQSYITFFPFVFK